MSAAKYMLDDVPFSDAIVPDWDDIDIEDCACSSPCGAEPMGCVNCMVNSWNTDTYDVFIIDCGEDE